MTASTTAGGTLPSARRSRWARQYLPVVSIVVALALAIVTLPSALNLPQSNPSQTLEFAPIPPDEDEPPPPIGNLSSLGLAGSGSLESGGLPGGSGGLPGGGSLTGVGKSPRTKECVTHPDGQIRQTEDPLSPPCVADFDGDNFGATWLGVTREEIRILFYMQGNITSVNTCADPNQSTPDKQYFDLWDEPEEGEHCIIRVLRTWQKYFSTRWQTYGRRPHFYVYVSGLGQFAEDRRADAAENFAKVEPFAAINVTLSNAEAYLDVMARRRVLNFGAFLSRSEAFFQSYPSLIWGYYPSLERQADMFAAYVCTKVAPYPVSFSDNVGENGTPRRYGLWRANDPAHPELAQLAQLAKDRLKEQCGIEFETEQTFPEAGFVASTKYSGRYATEAAAAFRAAEVTTIIWPGGLETNFTKQSALVAYLPEIVALGDGVLETASSGTFQDQTGWDGAHVVTSHTLVTDERQTICYAAFREADPEGDDAEIRAEACTLYPHIRQLFTGIQVAGPRLRPETVDQGFHAIPPLRSTNPELPACFYLLGDYTCVKDAMVQRWDRSAKDGQGCFRATEDGKRYLPADWPAGDVPTQEAPDDICNEFDGGFFINQAAPDTENF